jgi:HPt (histidine-containing phosphotransfer) domain-containing protein
LSFCQTIESARLKIQTAVHARDGVRLSNAAHALRGTLSMFSADPAVLLTRQLEAAGEAGNWEKVDSAHAAFESELKVLLPALAEFSSPAP